MTTVQIIKEIKNSVGINDEIFDNYFSDAIESANNYAIDSSAEAFDLGENEGIEFYEDGVNGIEDEVLRHNIDLYYFEAFETSLREKTDRIIFNLFETKK